MSRIKQPNDWKRMETAMLNQMVTRGSQEALLDAFKEISDNFNTITKDNADSTALLRKNIPSDALFLRKGKCLIISQENYKHNSFSDRDGTQKDVIELDKTFKRFGCNQPVIQRDIPDATAFKKVLEDFKTDILEQDPKSYDYVVICILSHGINDKGTEELVGVTGSRVPTEELLQMINDSKQCPCLAEKPKIFIIQACRGSRDNSNFSVVPEIEEKLASSSLIKDGKDDHSEKFVSEYCRESWYFKAYSTPKNYVALRHTFKGSPFVQAFCQTMNDFGDGCYSLEKIMKRTQEDLQRRSPPQSPEYSTTIPKDLYFTCQV